VLIKIGIDPVLVTIGGLKIHWYGIMIALGLYAGIQVALRDSARRGINRDQLMNLALLAAILGIAGGRLYYVVQNNPSFFLHNPAQIIAVWQGGMAFYGAIFGGALAVVIAAWRWHMPFWSVLDIGALGLAIGQTIGRVGNTYVVEPDGAVPGDTLRFTDPDFRTRAVKVNAVLRWEYRPGSTLFIVWTQSRSGYVPYDAGFDLERDFRRELFRDRPTNVLLVKLNYWVSM